MAYENDIYLDGATVAALSLGKTSTGKTQLAITFETTQGKLTVYKYFTDAAMPYTEADLRTLGWDPQENGWRVDDLLESQEIVGNVCNLVCGYEDYNGKQTLKVKFINDVNGGGGMNEKLSPDDAKAFTNSLRQQLGVTGGAKRKAAPKAKPPARAAAPVDADDIPF